jgi:hypothetical protein
MAWKVRRASTLDVGLSLNAQITPIASAGQLALKSLLGR